MSNEEEETKEEEKLNDLQASFPNAFSSTDEAILEFGALFVGDYAKRLEHELDQYKLAVELQNTLQGMSETPEKQRIGLSLRQSLIETLKRLSTIMERGLANGSEDTPGNIRNAAD